MGKRRATDCGQLRRWADLMVIRPSTTAAENVIAGWLGIPVPPMPKHRRRPYRKTAVKRPKREQKLAA